MKELSNDELSSYLQEINAEEVRKTACNLGAGRIRKEDKIDYTVGIRICKKVSENDKYVFANDTIEVYINKETYDKYKGCEM